MLLAGILMWAAVDLVAANIDFNGDVRPILSDNCFHCHGPDAGHRKADLRLDTEEGAKADLGGYHAIVPGKPEESELMARILHGDPEERMPPRDSGKRLDAAEVETLRQWIQSGAGWSAPWAYVPPRKHPAPEVRQADWPRNWIDPFILARLEAEGLTPSPDADPVTLVRRVSFDLTGLPPSPELVKAYLEDDRPNAWENLVDHLLNEPSYGERMAMYWLDLVRYADTVGYHGDQDHSISPYRDWVIDAFNRNMPLDQFTREQLAGDLLEAPTVDQRIATGYNRLLQTSHEGGVQAKEYLAMYAADRVRNLSSVWLGATMGCSQCHDHKYDPYTMRDFYSMAAFFADIDEARHLSRASNNLPTEREPEIRVLNRVQRKNLEAFDAEIRKLEEDIQGATAQAAADHSQRLEQLKKERAELEKKARRTMVTVSIKPRIMRVLPRGNWLDETGPVVEPAVPAFLGAIEPDGQRATRLDLANWLTDDRHGAGRLTARVFANRLWYLLLGNGIARDLDDFGGQGEPPDHPELLDNLALELVANGWDIKQQLKQIVMSRTYRQSSVATEALAARDPYNRLVGRQSRFRLPAETVRDNALFISGLLVPAIGGPSVKPYQPSGYYKHLNFPKRTYEHHADQRQWRRGVYMHWQRQFLHPMLKVMDAPRREECTAQRPRSNTPLAALTLLNDPTFVEAARVFAERILKESSSGDPQRIARAFRHAVSRSPEPEEIGAMAALLQSARHHYQQNPRDAEALLSTGLAPAGSSRAPVDLAAWTAVTRALLNLNETITRN